MAVTHRISTLTTTDAIDGGRCIQLSMLDNHGETVRLELPAHLASSLLLTLPRLMERCLRQVQGDMARLVFPVDSWELEVAVAGDPFILKFATADGYATSFAIDSPDAQAIGEALSVHCDGCASAPENRQLN